MPLWPARRTTNRTKIAKTTAATPALNSISMNVPVATSNPEIRWPEPNIINSRDSFRAPFPDHYAAAFQPRPPGKKPSVRRWALPHFRKTHAGCYFFAKSPALTTLVERDVCPQGVSGSARRAIGRRQIARRGERALGFNRGHGQRGSQVADAASRRRGQQHGCHLRFAWRFDDGEEVILAEGHVIAHDTAADPRHGPGQCLIALLRLP